MKVRVSGLRSGGDDLEKVVAVASGGTDSSTLLYHLNDKGYEPYALTFIYGQKHSKEVTNARVIAERLKIHQRTIDLSALNEILTCSALTNPALTIPDAPESGNHHDTMKTTIVPNRNAIFLCMAVGYAISIGSRRIFYGAHFSDRGMYPDCRKEFVDAFEHAMRIANDMSDLLVEAPFVDMKKSEIIRLGNSLGVPYELTWSCYRGGEVHCGTCSSCNERKRAFREANVDDPTVYER